MKINKQYIDDALNELSARKRRNRQTEDNRRSEVYEKIPEYSGLDASLAGTMTEAVSSLFNGSADVDVEAVFNKNRDIRKRMEELLEKNGFPADYLDPIYTCKKCKDSGNTGNEWCECICRITNELAAAELNQNAPLARSRFDNFKLEYYPEKDDEKKTRPREIMAKNFEVCKQFADNFSGKGSGIFMTGATGLGKTHLSLSIANVVIENGFCVVYISVPELIRKIQDEQINKKTNTTMSLILSSDLLILDDLGAENKNSDWCISTLYEIVNTRQNHSLPMIINTNLSPRQLTEIYHDRLSSRMLSMKTLFFFGNDNRVGLSENFG